MSTRRIMSALGVLLLGACTVGPSYKGPPGNVPGAFAPAGAPGSKAGGPAAPVPIAWWTALNDPVLDALVQKAGQNVDVRQAVARISETRAQRAAVNSALFPQFNGNAGYQRQRFSQNAAPFNAFDVPNFPWEFDSTQVGFDASWELDLFGGTRRATEAAAAEYQAAVEDRRAVLVSLQGEIARTYVELRSAQQQRAIAMANLDTQNQTLALTRDRVKNGVGSDLDVSRAQAQASATEAAIPLYDRAAWEAMDRIATLANVPLDSLTDMLTVRAIPTPPPTVSGGIPADLLRQRPDIRRAERQLAAASAQVGVAEADLYPKFSLSGAFALQSASVEDITEWRSRAFNLGPTVRWPIFEAGRLRAVVAVRTAQEDAALAAYDRTVQDAIQEVRDQLIEFGTETSRHTSLEQAVNADKDAVTLADGLYRQGLIDFLSVLDAQRQLYGEQDALAQSDAHLAESFIALQKALGGGWQADEKQPSPTTQPAGAAPAAPATTETKP